VVFDVHVRKVVVVFTAVWAAHVNAKLSALFLLLSAVVRVCVCGVISGVQKAVILEKIYAHVTVNINIYIYIYYKRACTIFFAHNHFCMCNETQLWCATACAHMTTYILYNIYVYNTYIYFGRGSAEKDVPEERRWWWARGWFFSQRVAHEEKINTYHAK